MQQKKTIVCDFQPLQNLLNQCLDIPSDVFVKQVSDDLRSLPEIKDDPENPLLTNHKLKSRLLLKDCMAEFFNSIRTAVPQV